MSNKYRHAKKSDLEYEQLQSFVRDYARAKA